MKIRLKATTENLTKLISACENYLISEFSSDDGFNLLITAVEEAFVNIASYAYKNETGYVDFEIFRMDNNRVKVIFSDRGIPFNPIMFNSGKNVENNLDILIPGGLGIELIKRSMKNLQYKYINEKNIFSLEAIREKSK